MKTKLKYIIFALLLFGVGAFNGAKAITADDLLVAVQQFASQVIQAFTQVGQALGDHDGRISDTDARIAALEQLVDQQHQAMQALLGCIDPSSDSLNLVFDGCNVHIRNGNAISDSANSLGNLIIGYNEDAGGSSRIGSHNLIIGPEHSYNGNNGIVAGTTTASFAVGEEKISLAAVDVDINSERDITVVSETADIAIESRQGRVSVEALISTRIEVGISDITLDQTNFSARSTRAKIEGIGELELKGLQTSLTGSASLDVAGGLIQLNDGSLPVARVGSTVIGTAGPYPVFATIAPSGPATVLVP